MPHDPLQRYFDPKIDRFQVVTRVLDGRRFWVGGEKGGSRMRSGFKKYEAWSISGGTEEFLFDSEDLITGRVVVEDDETHFPK